jgi:hypothetical protein
MNSFITNISRRIDAIEIEKNEVNSFFVLNNIKLKSMKVRDEIKELKTEIKKITTDMNIREIITYDEIAKDIINFLLSFEENKIDGLIDIQFYDDIITIYNILALKCNRSYARYIKIPKSWILRGLKAGVLEDLVVVMRTLVQLKISLSQCVTLEILISKFTEYIHSTTDFIRFPFLTKLFTLDYHYIRTYLISAIHSQGDAKRVNVIIFDGIEHFYAIQGLFKMSYDQRIVTILSSSTQIPPFAIHFTKIEIAEKIWKCLPTTSSKETREIPPGCICKFLRSIHALTNINYNNVLKKYYIITIDKKIRERMTHGISKEPIRQKYEAGLVINLPQLVNDFPNMCSINELGTLLVDTDIPHKYIVHCIIDKDEVEYFWNPT